MQLKRTIWIVTIIIAIAVSNIPIVSLLIGAVFGDRNLKTPDFQFTSGSGGFKSGSKYGSTQALFEGFEKYRKENPNDSILYRSSPQINPLKFWNWRDYLFEDVYKLPYKEAKE